MPPLADKRYMRQVADMLNWGPGDLGEDDELFIRKIIDRAWAKADAAYKTEVMKERAYQHNLIRDIALMLGPSANAPY